MSLTYVLIINASQGIGWSWYSLSTSPTYISSHFLVTKLLLSGLYTSTSLTFYFLSWLYLWISSIASLIMTVSMTTLKGISTVGLPPVTEISLMHCSIAIRTKYTKFLCIKVLLGIYFIWWYRLIGMKVNTFVEVDFILLLG